MKKVVGSSIVVSLLFWLVYAEQTSTTKEPEMQLPVESLAAVPSLTPDMEAAETLKKLEAAKKDEELKVKPPLSAQPDKDEDEDEDDYDFEEDEEEEDDDDGDWDEDDIDDDND